MTRKRELTDRQARFIAEYMVDLNATQAAIRAGYSEKTAKFQASRLLTFVNVQEAIQERAARLAEKAEITGVQVIRELARIGLSDMRRFVSWSASGVTLKNSDELEDGDAACVSEVSESVTKDGGSVRFKLHDKARALELLGKYLGMFRERMELTGPEGGPIQTRSEVVAAFDHEGFVKLFEQTVDPPGDEPAEGDGS